MKYKQKLIEIFSYSIDYLNPYPHLCGFKAYSFNMSATKEKLKPATVFKINLMLINSDSILMTINKKKVII